MQYAPTANTNTNHQSGKIVASLLPVPKGRIRPSLPNATDGRMYKNTEINKR